MNTLNPDKHIRKEIYQRLQNAEVNGILFKCFDSRLTSTNVKHYYLISTQLNQPNRTKCGRGWINSTEIQVIIREQPNVGSRVLLDDAVNEALIELDEFSLPSSSGMKISVNDLSIDNEFVQDIGSELIYTKILRLETIVN